MYRSSQNGARGGAAATLVFAVAFLVAATKCCYGDEPIPPSVITKLPSVLTLQDAIDIAFFDGPEQTLVRANLASALGLKLQTMSTYYPSITPAYSFQFTKITNYGLAENREAVGSSPPGVPTVNEGGDNSTTAQGGTTSIAFNQKIADIGQRELLNAEARQHVESAALTMEDVGEQRVDNVTNAYYQVLESLDFVKVAQATVADDQQILNASEVGGVGGATDRAGSEQAQANLDAAQVAVIQSQNQVDISKAALINAMGIVTDDPVQPQAVGPGDSLPPLPNFQTVPTLNQCYAIAQHNRKDLRSQLMAVDEARDEVKLARTDAGLSLSADYLLVYQPENDIGPRGAYSLLTLTASYPLMDGGFSRGAVRVADAALEASIATFEIDRQAVLQEVAEDYSDRQQSLMAITSAQTALQSAQENYNNVFDSYRKGSSSVANMTIAEETLTRAQAQYVSSVYDFYIADSNLARSTGQITLPANPNQ